VVPAFDSNNVWAVICVECSTRYTACWSCGNQEPYNCTTCSRTGHVTEEASAGHYALLSRGYEKEKRSWHLLTLIACGVGGAVMCLMIWYWGVTGIFVFGLSVVALFMAIFLVVWIVSLFRRD
jgi:hypothetical protein